MPSGLHGFAWVRLDAELTKEGKGALTPTLSPGEREPEPVARQGGSAHHRVARSGFSVGLAESGGGDVELAAVLCDGSASDFYALFVEFSDQGLVAEGL